MQKTSTITRIVFLLGSLGAHQLQVKGQPLTQSMLQGRVLDPARAPIMGAHVSIQVSDKKVFTGDSDLLGEFRIPLAAGEYTVHVTAGGFMPADEAITMPPTGSVTRDFTLAVEPVSFSISVTESGGYQPPVMSSTLKTLTLLRDTPQSVTVVPRELIRDQLMLSIGDVVKYVPGIQQHQGENNRDQVIIRGNSTSADFYVDGVRDDVQYYRDLYNLERVEAVKGPNAMIFGRGGGGGVINRVTKEPQFVSMREISLQGGSFGNKRATADFNQPLSTKVGFRMNGMYENSNSFRNNVGLERYGVSPTMNYLISNSTKLTIGYEHLNDQRIADRGVPSLQVPTRAFFGNPNDSYTRARVNIGTVALEHQMGGLLLVNRTSLAHYDRGCQNYVPGAVNIPLDTFALSGYNNATQRLNFFNQTNLTYTWWTGKIRHNLLGGTEIGTQRTDNFRNTGYFNNTTTSINAPLSSPSITTPVIFRQSATDANNHLQTRLGAAFLQDQVELNRFVQVVGGVRVDQFDLRYRNNRTSGNLRRIDNLISPRAGIVIKPKAEVSIYGSYTVSYLPSSGDQFASLTNVTQQVKPEKFTNYEAGVKWDVSNMFALTFATYRLDRTNTRSTDPNDPTRIIQTGSTRTNGLELGVNGNVTKRWMVAGGYSHQDAFISHATASALAGAQVGQVPHHIFSLWNNYSLTKKLSAGLGLLNRTDMWAAVDNTVKLPGYTRVDGALFYTFNECVRLQVNAENLANLTYWSNADSNTNISPGYPRSIKAALHWRF